MKNEELHSKFGPATLQSQLRKLEHNEIHAKPTKINVHKEKNEKERKTQNPDGEDNAETKFYD